MIILTGDIHGDVMRLVHVQEKVNLTKNDFIIVAGDFGIFWESEERYYKKRLEYLKRHVKAKILFVDGNHENYDILETFPIVNDLGEEIRQFNEQVYQLLRGRMYTIEGKNIFTFGGARSQDKESRKEGKTMWRQEEPTFEEINKAERVLNKNLDKIDYIITHECPNVAVPYLVSNGCREADYIFPQFLDSWLDLAKTSTSFKKWYFGHMHFDKYLGENLQAVYHDLIELR